MIMSRGPATAAAQVPDASRQSPATAPIERLGRDLVRVGSVTINMATKEIAVKGVVNDVTTLEFVANPKGGHKAYESAIELDTNAINFNTALILIGLDPAHAVPPTRHFDPATPKGDPVEIWVDWEDGIQHRSMRAEQLIYNEATKQTLANGPWVYTGSAFVDDGTRYLAEADGVLIGFVHTPEPIIESPRPFLPEHYGAVHLNPALKLTPGTKLTVRVRSLAGTTK